MTATATTATIAEALDTTPRTLRKFLRSEGAGVGKGSRYSLPSNKREINSLKKRFAAWSEARDAAKVETAPEAPAEVETAPEVETDFDDLECPLDA